MAAGSIDTSGGLTSNSTLTNDGANGALQITGLASGINTNEIIQAELAEKEQPIDDMQNEIAGIQTEDSQLTSIQDALQGVLTDVQNLGDPSTFFPTQTVTSTDPSLITATATGGVGAVIGSSTIGVTQLASAASRTFTFTSPTSTDNITIDNQPLTISAGETSAQVADAINSSDNYDVYASATDSGTLVLSSRSTGLQSGSYIQVSDPGSALVEQTSLANAGQDAEYTVNGVAATPSPTDTVANAIPGVSLTLNGVTGNDPVTVTVSPPGPDTASIVQAVQQFVSDYNSAIGQIESVVNTAPASESNSSDFNPNSGSLYGDDELENVLSDMRDAMIQPGSGLPAGMAALSDIGITTGASTGTISQSAINGDLSVNTTQLEQALQSNPQGVQAVLQAWSTNLGNVINNEAGPGGGIDSRLDGDSQEVTNLQTQYSAMQTLFQQQEQDMEQQWAQVEATLSKLHSQSTALTSFASSQSSSSSSS